LSSLERILVAEGKVGLPRGDVGRIREDEWTVDSLLSGMEKAGEGMDAVLLAWADEPFLDPALAEKMLGDFKRYRAEYCFADGYPVGLAAEIVSPRVLPALRKLASELPSEITRGSLFAVIQKDINAFDIETDISPVDLRDLRLELACDTKRNTLLVNALAQAGVRDAPSALKIIPERMELLRTLPSFIQVQVASGCPQSCKLCPYPLFAPGASESGGVQKLGGDMSRDAFASLLDQIVALSEDAVIDISLWGEPSRHPDIGGLVDEVLSRPSLSLIIETSGIGWGEAFEKGLANRIKERDAAGRIDWIVSLDAWSPELYEHLRGEGYAEAVAFADALIALFPSHAHVQMVRSRENEVELEAFWRGWKKKTDKVIVQKYSRQTGLLPELKVSDLSPLGRRPCWHLKRDLSILVDGRIPLCRDASHLALTMGNAFAPGGLAAAWKAGDAYHEKHIEACVSGGAFPFPCEVCDEYYTYNA
jgi:spiro-SPASM protein